MRQRQEETMSDASPFPTDPAPDSSSPSDVGTLPPRVFLVVIDDTDEWRAALRFACMRAAHTNGRVALLAVIEPTEFQHWTAVEDIMRNEVRQEAEILLQRVAKTVNDLIGSRPILYLREGSRRDELVKLIDEEPSVSILVLGAKPGKEGPGPLIQFLTTSRIGTLRIPVTIVPGGLSDLEIDSLA
jgi:nucleotide-binding universal stress UspA family protein